MTNCCRFVDSWPMRRRALEVLAGSLGVSLGVSLLIGVSLGEYFGGSALRGRIQHNGTSFVWGLTLGFDM